MKNIFLCLTPLHVLTAYTISERKDNDRVVLVDQKGILGSFASQIIQCHAFKDFIYINSQKHRLQEILSYLRMPFQTGSSYHLAAGLDIASGPACIYVFNDIAPQSQIILKKSLCQNIIYIEDGSAPYNGHWIKKSTLKTIAINILFKWFYHNINIIGTSRYIKESILRHPNLARKEHRTTPARPLIRDIKKIKILSEAFIDKSRNQPDNNEYFLVFPSSTLTIENAIKLINRATLPENKNKINILVKEHPLSRLPYINNPNVTLIEKTIPSELIPYLYPNIKAIIGSRTTALQTLKDLLPNTPIYNANRPGENTYDDFLSKIGVKRITYHD